MSCVIEAGQIQEALRLRFGSALTGNSSIFEPAAELLRQYSPHHLTFHQLAVQLEESLREAGEDPTLLLGADKLPELDHLWQYIPEIASEFGIVCMDRADLDCDTLIRKSPFLSSLNIRVVHVPDSYKDFSSSRVRDCLFHLRGLKDELTALLPPELGNLPSDLLKNQGNNNENLC